MPEPIVQALTLIIMTLFFFVNSLLIIRITLQMIRANYYNPICAMVVKLTDPIILPLRKVLPRLAFIDLAPVLWLFIFSFIKLTLLILVRAGVMPNPIGLLILVMPDIIGQVIDIYFWLILISVVLSWLPSMQNQPAIDLLYKLTEPVLSPARRLIRPISGFDISPVLVLLALKLISILVVGPVTLYGSRFL